MAGSGQLRPGETAEIYTALTTANATGRIVRIIQVFTTDPDNSLLLLQITARVTFP